MFQFEFEGALFRFDAKAPTSKPLLQLPPTRAASCAPLFFLLSKYSNKKMTPRCPTSQWKRHCSSSSRNCHRVTRLSKNHRQGLLSMSRFYYTTKKIFEPSALLWGKNSPKPPYCKGGLQERDAPTAQYESEGALSRLDAKAPTSKPSLQAPPTRA